MKKEEKEKEEVEENREEMRSNTSFNSRMKFKRKMFKEEILKRNLDFC